MLWIPIAFVMMGICALASEISDNAALGIMASIGGLILLLSMGVAAVGGLILLAKPPSAEYYTLKKKHTELQTILSKKPEDTSTIAPEFQGKTSQELRNIQSTRKQLIEETMEQVDGYDRLLVPPT